MLVLDSYDFDSKEIASATIAKIFAKANLTEQDQEMLYLRFGEEWHYHDIAKHIGSKYEGRTDTNPLCEGTIRYRIKNLLADLRNNLKNWDFLTENP